MEDPRKGSGKVEERQWRSKVELQGLAVERQWKSRGNTVRGQGKAVKIQEKGSERGTGEDSERK